MTQTLQQYHDEDIAYYLIDAMVAVNNSQIKDPEKAKILEVLDMAKVFEDLYKKYELIGEERGRKEGRAEGRAEGRLKEKQEIAKRLFKKDIDIRIISEITGLTEQEIHELINK